MIIWSSSVIVSLNFICIGTLTSAKTSSALFGQIDNFDANGKEYFSNYLLRLEFYFLANGIEDSNKKIAYVFDLGRRGHLQTNSRYEPDTPTSKLFDELCRMMHTHLNPEPNVIVERFLLCSRMRKDKETVKEYIAQLRHLSRRCKYRSDAQVYLTCSVLQFNFEKYSHRQNFRISSWW